MAREPASTALLTTHVIEPGMPESCLERADVREERWLCTFRGCGNLVRRAELAATGGYDERFFIYGNERDLATRILDRGGRIKLCPGVVTFHATPFGLEAGKRSLHDHVRNSWLDSYKHCAWSDVLRAAWRLDNKALGLGRQRGTATAATSARRPTSASR